MSNNSKPLKMGDRVRIVGCESEPDKKHIGENGIIIEVDRICKHLSRFCDYECEFPDGSTYIFARKELKHLQIGEQLLLFEEV